MQAISMKIVTVVVSTFFSLCSLSTEKVLTELSASNTMSSASAAQDRELPLKPTRTIEFTTTEGTDMSVDLSPDGKVIIFDLLGDLYTVPIAGGKSTRLTHGLAWDKTPKFSPDGRQI